MAQISVDPVHREPDTLSTTLYSRINWGAVFAGLVVTLVIQFVLSLLGLAVGLTTIDAAESARGLGIGALIWTALTALIGLYMGGRTTGHLAGLLSSRDGFLHGLLTWGMATLVGLWLIGNGLGAVVGGALNLTGNVVSATAGGVARGASSALGAAGLDDGSVSFSDVRREIEQILRQTGNPALSPDSLSAAASQVGRTATGSASNEGLVDQFTSLLSSRAAQVDREEVINVVVARTDLSRAEAERLADRMIAARDSLASRVAGIRESAGEVAEEAAGRTAGALWIALLVMGLSLGAAVFGAVGTART